MKKLHLNVESLDVQSFAAGEAPEARGTVRGHLPMTHPNMCAPTFNWLCPTVNTYTVFVQFCAA